MSRLSEEPANACAFLVYKISKLCRDRELSQEARSRMLLLVLRDLSSKGQGLSNVLRNGFFERARSALSEAGDLILPLELLRLVDPTSESAGSGRTAATGKGYEKPRVDVIIITVIDVERQAVLKAFGAVQAKRGKYPVGSRELFQTPILAIERPGGGRDLDVYVAMVGEPRNVPCANLCRDLIAQFDVGCLILVGIAGGDREAKLEQGDVLGVDSVFYVEAGKRRRAPRLGRNRYARLRCFDRPNSIGNWLAEASMRLFGAEPFFEPEILVENLPQSSKNFLNDFRFRKTDVLTSFGEAIGRYEVDDFPRGKNILNGNFDYHHPANITCGEKVVVDGSIETLRKEVNRRIAGVDMESYGFASTCNYMGTPWLIFRGISDFADPKKDDARHVSAAVAAAVTARSFLVETYRTLDELNLEF